MPAMVSRYLLAAALAFTGLSPAAVQAQVSAAGAGLQTTERARLRAGPGSQYAVIGVIPAGEALQVLQRAGEWLRVRYTDATKRVHEGWISAALLQTPRTAEPKLAVAVQLLLQVVAPRVPLRAAPDAAAPAIGSAETGVELEANARAGDWYRILRADGSEAWVLNADTATGPALAVNPLPPGRQVISQHADEDGARRPQGTDLEPRLPVFDPSQVSAPTPYDPRESLPVRDRWRLARSLGLLRYRLSDPYNPNPLKGDVPVLEDRLGPGWFVNLTAISDTLLESRRLPTPVGPQSTLSTGANSILGRGRQNIFAETAIINLSLIKGNTTFQPPDWEFRFVPVLNINRAEIQEARGLNVNPRSGYDRNDSFAGVQELFVDKHLRDVSMRYDFDSLRFGIQPFTADFRGFLFNDQPFGLRVFGTRDNNQWQYNVAAFRRLEKDTNSGLNDIGRRMRADAIYVANLYRQDFPVPGFTLQGVALHNRNREGSRGQFFNQNDFLERPAIFGSGRPHNYQVTYLGLNGDGHFGRWNLSASLTGAFGRDERGMISGREERIGAWFAAAELSRDFDWIRLRASALYASGDRDPFDAKSGGYDAVLENPLFAGADTSYWIRQSIPLIGGGGTALSIRNGVLASLRSSREHGQSNFVNPGLRLAGIGADLDLSPELRLIGNLNRLYFDRVAVLAVLRNQRLNSSEIGTDASIAIQYRPLFIQNVVLNASFAMLLPGRALKELYGDAVEARQYSALFNLLLTY